MKQIGKKLLIALLVLVCLLTFAACVNENGTTASKTDTTSDNTITPSTDNNQPPAVHTHKYTADITSPSCTEGGYTTYTCECGDKYVADEVEALGHKKMTVTGTQATCEETGLTDGVRCSECGQWLTEQVVIAPTGHKDADGDGKCDGCSADMTSVCIHTYESVVTAPTCTEDGYTTHTCTVCGHNYVDELVAAKGHDPKLFGAIGAGCTREGYTGDLRCANCNELYSTGRVIPAGGHGSFEIRNAKAPTATEEGYTGDTYCSFCGKCTEKGETIPAIGNHEEHTYEHIQIPLEGYDLCGAYIESDVCVGCGFYSNPTIDFDCDFYTREFEMTENTVHTVVYCWRCGLTCEITAELLESEGCMCRWRGTMKLTKSETELLTFDFELEEDDHNYQSVDKSLREYGFCGGVYSYWVCVDCGDVVSADVDAWACQWVEQGVDEDGYTVSLCSECGAYRYEKTVEQTDEHCYHSVDYTAVYQLGEYSITAKALTATFEHDYTISYTFKDGLSCENGWTATYACGKCGESYTVEGEGHNGERVTED